MMRNNSGAQDGARTEDPAQIEKGLQCLLDSRPGRYHSETMAAALTSAAADDTQQKITELYYLSYLDSASQNVRL